MKVMQPIAIVFAISLAAAMSTAAQVIVEQGGGGGARAAPLAGNLLRTYLAARP